MAYARLLDRTGRLSGSDLNRVQLRLVTYLTRANDEDSARGREEFFKDLLLIVNPQVYQGVYDEKGRPKSLSGKEEEMEVPKTEADVERMMEMLRRTSVPIA
jgi:hypothetical protein